MLLVRAWRAKKKSVPAVMGAFQLSSMVVQCYDSVD